MLLWIPVVNHYNGREHEPLSGDDVDVGKGWRSFLWLARRLEIASDFAVSRFRLFISLARHLFRSSKYLNHRKNSCSRNMTIDDFNYKKNFIHKIKIHQKSLSMENFAFMLSQCAIKKKLKASAPRSSLWTNFRAHLSVCFVKATSCFGKAFWWNSNCSIKSGKTPECKAEFCSQATHNPQLVILVCSGSNSRT